MIRAIVLVSAISVSSVNLMADAQVNTVGQVILKKSNSSVGSQNRVECTIVAQDKVATVSKQFHFNGIVAEQKQTLVLNESLDQWAAKVTSAPRYGGGLSAYYNVARTAYSVDGIVFEGEDSSGRAITSGSGSSGSSLRLFIDSVCR